MPCELQIREYEVHHLQIVSLTESFYPRLPYLEEEAYEWYTSFNLLGELVRNPNPTPAADLLMRVFAHLTTDCSWPPNRIHMFGFAQGGTVAAEVGIKWWRTELEKLSKEKKDKAGETSEDTKANEPGLLGSIVSVCGPLISYPTLQNLCPTPILILHRPAPAETALPSGALSAFKKGYSNVTDLQMGRGEGMPRSRTEWEPIMRFWSERLGKRQMDGLYEVMSGITPA